MRALVTGGAGFIGSNLVDALLAEGHTVRVLDDLSTGYADNIGPEVELVHAGIADEVMVRKAVEGIDHIFHLAAHRAVLRSVSDPIATDTANTHGTVILLKAAVDAGVRRVVSASSSSVYGGAEQLPTPETAPLLPRSPYAVTKLAGEHYCRVFAELYGLETVCLRYFNVYGPRQRPDSAYAAVVPLFAEALRSGMAPEVHGDGNQTRSFTYVGDAVAANLAAARAATEVCRGKAFNVAGARRASLLELLEILARVVGTSPRPRHTEPRAGDIRHSYADLERARIDLGYEPTVDMEEGLRLTLAWFEGEAARSRPADDMKPGSGGSMA